ncbi:MAG: hypothetical protein L6R36_002077 [Xanthoria steineri]|nr:MAG: hypothetical protein L6R36_002077 [Xanthoria steineri]
MTDTAVPSSSDNTTRGIPYYEKLKRDLRETLQKKRALDKNMATLEDQIYRIEAAYLDETASAGNIIKGFDNYIKGSALSGSVSAGGAAGGGGGGAGGGGGGGGGGGTSTRRKGVTEQDRVFSRSSCSFMRELSPTSSIQSTPNAPTPTSGNLPPPSARASDHPTPTSATSLKGGGNKKNKKGVEREDEESEGKQPKRLKITYARGGVGGD